MSTLEIGALIERELEDDTGITQHVLYGLSTCHLVALLLMSAAARERVLRAASGMSASGQDPQGLEAKPASPAPQGETPNLSEDHP